MFFVGSSGRITFEDFRVAITSLNIGIDDDDDIKDIFKQFDTTKNGQFDLCLFLQEVRPPMNERRRQAALDIFNSLDVNKDGKLTIVDFKVCPSIDYHNTFYFHFLVKIRRSTRTNSATIQ
jgi:Ca2+-binding EF-hand superfamily protein